MAHRLGITMVPADGIQSNGEPYGISLTLGAAEVSPLDMAAAYGVFAARGNQFPATPGRQGHRRQRQGPRGQHQAPGAKRVLAEAVADNVTDALKGVVTSGTGTGADIGRPDGTAGKTGSTDENRDAWFVGYTPALSTVGVDGLQRLQHPLAPATSRACRRSTAAPSRPRPGRTSWAQALKDAPAGRLPQARPPGRRRHRRRPPGARRHHPQGARAQMVQVSPAGDALPATPTTTVPRPGFTFRPSSATTTTRAAGHHHDHRRSIPAASRGPDGQGPPRRSSVGAWWWWTRPPWRCRRRTAGPRPQATRMGTATKMRSVPTPPGL